LNKKKIINDPVYGFITIPDGLIYDLISHPYFQRLRRIKQMGLNDFVYPGALHTRFHHALGAMHLMTVALHHLRSKGHSISNKEYQAMLMAILLHDVGHGPFSHALESSILRHSNHEEISLIIMQHLNRKFKGKLNTAIEIFQNQYPRKFLHQLVSSQLDIDRLDYLRRDSFFTGVSEGTISSDRILILLSVHDDKIVVEEKGIYSIENFLNARRLMYWQVYLHKTSVAAETMLVQLISRAQELTQKGLDVPGSPNLQIFLQRDVTSEDLQKQPEILEAYCQLDDYDIWGAVKSWQYHSDPVLSGISSNFLNRELFQIKIASEPFDKKTVQEIKQKVRAQLGASSQQVKYWVYQGKISNSAYISGHGGINILTKEGTVKDIAQASDLPNIKALSKIVKKYYLCWPKSLNL
jgi:HD superfamily phosphohydrolase